MDFFCPFISISTRKEEGEPAECSQYLEPVYIVRSCTEVLLAGGVLAVMEKGLRG